MAAPHRTILLVEDERLIALSEATLLRQCGYEVVNAYSGEEAIRKVESAPRSVDLVLMDVDLGHGIDGTEAARRILELEDLPVLFLSSHAESSFVEKTERITNYGYVVKSSAFAVLDASIKMALKLFDSNRRLAEQEEAARRSELQYRRLFEYSLDAIAMDEILFDESGKPCDFVRRKVNPAFERLSGRRAADIVDKRASELLSPEDFRTLLPTFASVVTTGRPSQYEAFHEGISRYLRAGAYPGEGNFLTVIIEDVTEAKESLESLHRRDEYLEGLLGEQARTAALLEQKSALLTSIFESSPEVIVFALDREYRYIAFNRRHQETIRQIWGKDIELGTNMLEVIMDESDRATAKANFDRALAGEHFALEEMYGDTRLTRAAWLDYYSPILDSEGKAIGLSCFVLNITERKRAELQITQLLKEKDLILREVHHRVKNNMSTVSSLLNIRARLPENAEARTILNDAVASIHSMMVLYDRLYRSSTFDKVSFKGYLSSLLGGIVDIFPRQLPVAVETSLDEVELDAGIASNLGIITNELVTNSMKHAFPRESADDRISIEVRAEGNVLRYAYADNGIGLPRDFSFETASGFGLPLVKMLIDQLRGSIRAEGGAGARFEIEVPL